MRAPETPLKKIQKVDNSHFDVQSSNSKKTYQIDLFTTTCSCSDFPYIRLCKHIAAVVHFFGGANLGPQPPCADAPSLPVQQNGSAGSSDDGDIASASVVSTANDILSLTQDLISKAPLTSWEVSTKGKHTLNHSQGRQQVLGVVKRF